MIIDGLISKHYFVCPLCRIPSADLETHKCTKCGAEVVQILWDVPADLSPELVMIGREYNDS